jgi:formimidoylglutamate deiminase
MLEHLHQPLGWLSPGYVEIDGTGVLVRVSGQEPLEWQGMQRSFVPGFTVPGMPNVHSHAFQRALAGHTECADSKTEHDSFWTWRAAMYRLANVLLPHEVEAIAAQLYSEMLETGMTCVAEFHYLHHAPDGTPYEDAAEMSWRIVAAAHEAGIALTHIPVFYAHAGIGEPASIRQKRFIHTQVDPFLTWVEQLRARAPETTVGIAAHSLRAVSLDELQALCSGIHAMDAKAPIHIHVAEQQAEVDECIEKLGQRPVLLLLDRFGLDPRWCLVHATHTTAEERLGLARSGAVVALCPSTEANLGDGLFSLPDFMSHGGTMAIGSDSHVTVSTAEELRLLEYGQRLRAQQRNVSADRTSSLGLHVGRRLFDAALLGGARAVAQSVGALTEGRRADLCVLDGAHPLLCGHDVDTVLDAWTFSSGSRSPVRDVMVGGQWVVRESRHVRHHAIAQRFVNTMRSLRGRL